jgi:hypothetical protein
MGFQGNCSGLRVRGSGFRKSTKAGVMVFAILAFQMRDIILGDERPPS